MAELEIYLYSNCTSCRKAEELLREKGVDAKQRDYFKQRFTKPELSAVLDRAGVTPFDVLSTRSKPYRELGLAGRTLSENELLELMVAHPQLLKRPLIIKNGHSTVGYNRSAIEALIEE
jgi:arsenate reductase (glutaredoxin)